MEVPQKTDKAGLAHDPAMPLPGAESTEMKSVSQKHFHAGVYCSMIPTTAKLQSPPGVPEWVSRLKNVIYVHTGTLAIMHTGPNRAISVTQVNII